MARFLLVLKPRESIGCRDLIGAMDVPVDPIGARMDHRAPAHPGALVRRRGENLQLQLCVDVQDQVQGRLNR
ncbi:MAG: hypothetical protein WAM11_13435 [Cyanobium sp.]